MGEEAIQREAKIDGRKKTDWREPNWQRGEKTEENVEDMEEEDDMEEEGEEAILDDEDGDAEPSTCRVSEHISSGPYVGCKECPRCYAGFDVVISSTCA